MNGVRQPDPRSTLEPRAGERLLCAAILEDAIECFHEHLLSSDAAEQRLYRDADDWIMGRRPHDLESPRDCFTFIYVCRALGIDARGLREQLRRWRESQIHGRLRRLGIETGDDAEQRANAALL